MEKHNLIIISIAVLCCLVFAQALYEKSRVKEVGMGSLSGEDLINPEIALKHGFKGYVDVCYVSEVPNLVIVSPGKEVNLTIQLKLIPHVQDFTETEVLFDPENSNEYGVGPGDLVFNDYVCYSPSGRIVLRVDEPQNIVMMLSVPEGFPGMSTDPRELLGVGMMADVPVSSEWSVQLDRIND